MTAVIAALARFFGTSFIKMNITMPLESQLACTLAEKAYHAVLNMIQQRNLKGGQQIIELRLANELGISRTPIRQALRLLEGEGLLEKSGGRSYVVRQVDLREYLQSLKVREILESEAAYSATNFVSDKKIKIVRKKLKVVEKQRPYDVLSHWQSDSEVHELFISACPNVVLRNVIRSLRVTTKLFEIENLAERLEPDSRQHEAILEALQNKMPTEAKQAVQIHINSLYQFALSVL